MINTEILLIVCFVPLILLLTFALHSKTLKSDKWELREPIKKKGSFPLYYEDRHMANIRGKEKAKMIIKQIGGKSSIK